MTENEPSPCSHAIDALINALIDASRTPGLSEARNFDGRPIWEPPILNYSHLIDTPTSQSYTKRREAVLAYTYGDVDVTTSIMDEYTESELLTDYIEWAKSNVDAAEDDQAIMFFETLRDDLREDLKGVQGEVGWIRFDEPEDGKWTLKEPEPWVYDDDDFDCLEGYEEGDEERHPPVIADDHVKHHISTVTTARHVGHSNTPGLHLGLRLNRTAGRYPASLAIRLLTLQNTNHEDELD